jgi:hypothetical protein
VLPAEELLGAFAGAFTQRFTHERNHGWPVSWEVVANLDVFGQGSTQRRHHGGCRRMLQTTRAGRGSACGTMPG